MSYLLVMKAFNDLCAEAPNEPVEKVIFLRIVSAGPKIGNYFLSLKAVGCVNRVWSKVLEGVGDC